MSINQSINQPESKYFNQCTKFEVLSSSHSTAILGGLKI